MERVWTEVDKESGVVYELWIEQDELQVRGNAMALGDAKEDKKVEDSILRRLRNGETWAWAQTKCVAAKDDLEGCDYLGGCSYKDTQEFIQPGGYWDDMKAQALADLERRQADRPKRRKRK